MSMRGVVRAKDDYVIWHCNVHHNLCVWSYLSLLDLIDGNLFNTPLNSNHLCKEVLVEHTCF